MDLTEFDLQEIKIQPITPKQLDTLYQLTQSYEVLFSKRAKKYTEMKLKDKKLTETDIRQLILEEYTFLKRPVIVCNQKVTIG